MKKLFILNVLVAFALITPATIFAQGSFHASLADDDEETAAEDSASDDFYATPGTAGALGSNQDSINEADARAQEESSSRVRDWSSTVNFGTRGALGTTTFTGSDASDWGFGFIGSLAGVLRVSLGESFGVAPEVGLSYRYLSYEAKATGYKATIDLSALTLDIPLLFQYYLNDSWTISLGPQLSFILSSSDKEKYTFPSTSSTINDVVSTSLMEAGLAVGAGWNLDRDMIVDLRLFKSFTDFADNSTDYSATSITTLTIQAGFTYMFL